MKNLKMALMASTAVAALGWHGALAQSLTIDSAPATTDETAIDIANGLENFLSGTRQISTDATADDGAVDLNQTIDITDTDTAISVGQSILSGANETKSRLNQATSTLDVSTSLASNPALTGGLSIDPVTPAEAIELTAGVGAGTLQSLVDGRVATTLDSLFQIEVDSIGMSGDAVIAGTRAIADSLGNDSVSTVTVAGVGGDSVSTPAAIANFQTATIDDGTTLVDALVNQARVGIDLTDATGSTAFALTGDASVDANVIGARAGVNSTVNTLTAGTAASVAGGLGTADNLSLASGDVGTGVLAFVADYAIGNVQISAADVSVASDVAAGVIEILVGNTVPFATPATIAGSTLSARGNSILSDATINTAANTATITTAGLTGASAGIGSLQDITGTGTTDLTADTAGTVQIAGVTTFEPLLDGASALEATGNVIAASLGGNVAENTLRIVSTGAQGGQTGGILGRQDANTVEALATVGTADVTIAEMDMVDGDTATLAANRIAATGEINRQDNVLTIASLGATADDVGRIDGVQTAAAVELTSAVTLGDFRINVNDNAAGTGGTLTLRDNEFAAMAALNVQNNSLGFTDGSLNGGVMRVNGAQNDSGSTVNATLGDVSVTADMNESADGVDGTMSLLNNSMTASAEVNRQANLIVASDASGYSASQLAATSSQQLTDTTVAAEITTASIEAISGSGPAATASLVGNTIGARSAGNVSTSTISATRGNGFSFSR